MDYPRVTEILRNHTGYDNVPKDILDRAAARGSTVHAICAGIAKGAWVPDGMIGQEILGYVNSFKKWSEAQVKQFVTIEKRYVDEHLKYTGQIDFIVVGNDEAIYLVDLKTSAKPQKTYPVQMAAYENLLRKHKIEVKGAMLVYLDKDGEFPNIHLIEGMTEEFHVFLSALDCYNYFHRRKKDERKTTTEHIPENIGSDERTGLCS